MNPNPPPSAKFQIQILIQRWPSQLTPHCPTSTPRARSETRRRSQGSRPAACNSRPAACRRRAPRRLGFSWGTAGPGPARSPQSPRQAAQAPRSPVCSCLQAPAAARPSSLESPRRDSGPADPHLTYASPVPVRRLPGSCLLPPKACSPAGLLATPITKESKFEYRTTADLGNQAARETGRRDGFRLCSSPAETSSFRVFQSRPDPLDAHPITRQLFPEASDCSRQTRRRPISLKQTDYSMAKKLRLTDEERIELQQHLERDYSASLSQEDALLILECSKLYLQLTQCGRQRRSDAKPLSPAHRTADRRSRLQGRGERLRQQVRAEPHQEGQDHRQEEARAPPRRPAASPQSSPSRHA